MSKQYQVKYEVDANGDLRSIFEYISIQLENPQSAEKIVSRITAKCDALKVFPRTGKVWQVVRGREMRRLRMKKYMIVYYVEDDTVVIARVLYAKMEFKGIFGI